MARCVDCAYQSFIDWSRGVTELSGYCPEGNHYISKHVNKHGVNQSLHAQRKCHAFKPKTETPIKGKEADEEVNRNTSAEKRMKLVALIRCIARDEVYNILYEHIQDYEHKQRKPEPTEI